MSDVRSHMDPTLTLGGEGEPERIQGYWVSASCFELPGTRPQPGRRLLPLDPTVRLGKE